jgi:DNA-directed RNA polymerase subunit RPC12/RpoP
MTIEFNCPKCGALIAFDSKHAGKRAKCLTCGQKLIIPSESFKKPEEVQPPPEPKGEPTPGFYRAVFVSNWRLFVDRRNVTTLTFVVAVVCFKFFLATACCMNYIAAFIIWGWLFGFYLNVIAQTAWDDDQLPEIEVGTSITFLVYVLGPFFTFFYTLFLVELPFLIALWLTEGYGVTVGNLWSSFDSPHLLAQGLLVTGVFVFPAAILTTAVGQDFLLLRPDYLLAPIVRALPAYIVTVTLLAGTCLLAWHATQYTGPDLATIAKDLGLNLAVQVVAIFAMRSIGLFYRHYACHFKW